MNEYYVYEWYIVDSNIVFYVGKGKGKRCYEHKRRNKFFLDVYKTHECAVRKIFENLSEQDAFEKEKETIAYYRSQGNHYLTNVTDGGEGISGWVPNQEFKMKQSKISKARWQDDDFVAKMKEIRNSEQSPYKTQQFREKITKLVSGNMNPNFGNFWTQEQKNRLSDKQKKSGRYNGENNPNAKSIICLETGEVFNTIKSAMDKYFVKDNTIFSIALKERQRTAGGLHWLLYCERLNDGSQRFFELLYSMSMASTNPIICMETKELFQTRKDFLQTYKIGIKRFENEYQKNGKFQIEDNNYMYIKDYLQSLM